METISKNDDESSLSSIIKTISNILNEIISENKENTKTGKAGKNINFTVDQSKSAKLSFTSKKPPTITIQAYLERILKYTKMEKSTLIITLIYIDRLCEFNQIMLSPFNIHR